MNAFSSRMHKFSPRMVLVYLALAAVIGVFCVSAAPTSASNSYCQPYLDKVVEWGVMRGDLDGNLDSDRNITRAEFITMVNRAYGYTETGRPIPFTDVKTTDWFYDDICIAYNVGYLKGTSSTTASPNDALTREEAAVILARNMQLEESTGETLGFTDTRQLSDWSRGLIQSLVEEGVINGYTDGTFKPKNSITRGETAIMLVRAIGTPIQEEGEQTLGDVYGNVTITTSNVQLKDTNIVGNLYLSGGVNLGAVELQNVTVTGKIVISGGGESEIADSSIVLRNVDADNLLVDSIIDKFVTLRAEGTTNIGVTNVHSGAYLDDSTSNRYGLAEINISTADGETVYLAGNIKQVRNLTPSSTLVLAQGTADQITVDEKATGSTLTIKNEATAQTINLDTGTTVNGDGDVDEMNVNAAGTSVTMLPDQITVRPGITADVYDDKVMNNITAEESSETPRILADYPDIEDAAPTSALVVFQTNKRGTLYWTVSAEDDAVSADNVVSPPTYGGKILNSGSIAVSTSKTDVTVKLSGLTAGGKYRVTAVLVDNKNQYSPVKYTTFETPDNSTPAFASGYPSLTKIESDNVQFTVMPTKTCKLYYALFPKGSSAPSTAEFKTNAVANYALWSGTAAVTKNKTVSLESIDDVTLEEVTAYDLYFWLEDNDGVKNSAVKKMSFTTLDGTPPVVTYIDQKEEKTTGVTVNFTLSEPGTLYWAIVQEGDDLLRPLAGQDTAPAFDELAAKIQVENGMGAIKKGSSNASKAETMVNLSISGLTAQTKYDLYYVAKDKAGNYSAAVAYITVNTLDNQPPTVTQEFTKYNGTDTTKPLSDTDIKLVFSESVQGVELDSKGNKTYTKWMDLYKAVIDEDKTEAEKQTARETLAAELRKHIILTEFPDGSAGKKVAERTKDSKADDAWTIDYRYAQITMENGKMIVTLPSNANSNISALNLKSGEEYQFSFSMIADTSTSNNMMKTNSGGVYKLPQFTTVYAIVNLTASGETNTKSDGSGERLDISFKLTPVSTGAATDSDYWDMMLWSDTTVKFQLYRREIVDGTAGEWELVTGTSGKDIASIAVGNSAEEKAAGGFNATSIAFSYNTTKNGSTFDKLKSLDENTVYEYGIHFTSVGSNGSEDYQTWGDKVTMKVGIAAGTVRELTNLCGNVVGNWETMTNDEDGAVSSIGLAAAVKGTPDELTLTKQFIDQTAPSFSNGYPVLPTAQTHSTSVTINYMLDREATVYWVVAPQGTISTKTKDDGTAIDETNSDKVSEMITKGTALAVSLPNYTNIIKPTYDKTIIQSGSDKYSGMGMQSIDVTGLTPNTDYYVYFVLKGSTNIYSDVLMYKFTTTRVEIPALDLDNVSPNVKITSTNTDAHLYYILVNQSSLNSVFTQKFSKYVNSDYKTARDNGALSEDITDAIEGTNGQTAITVIEAMIRENDENQSWFDLYANDSIRKTAQAYISGSNNTDLDVYRKEIGSIKMNVTSEEKLTSQMTTGPQYYLLACAQHVSMGTSEIASYGFKAVSNVHIPDAVPPTLVSGTSPIQAASLVASDGTTRAVWCQNPDGYSYNGTVTVNFDKEVYYIDDLTSQRKAVVLQKKGTDLTALQSAVGLPLINAMDVIGTNATILESGSTSSSSGKPTLTIGNSTNSPGKSFTFEFTNFTDGCQIVFFNSGKIGNYNGAHTDKTLVLTFSTALKQNSYSTSASKELTTAMPGFTVSWGN